MSMATGSGSGSVRADPNVTPMIDVMLVLLIIFMIVTPALLAGFSAVPPEGVNLKSHPEEDTDQVLGIDRDGIYYLNKSRIPNDKLASELNRIYTARTADKILFVKADRNLEYDKVLTAMDIAAKNGVRVVGAIADQHPGTESTVAGDVIKTGPGAKKP
ncbi:MAG: biopolymer transporter ExbD [Gemmatimonadota bacterium]|nr:biopolymer transporter ExbD [Gemmatimonadota bacterium]